VIVVVAGCGQPAPSPVPSASAVPLPTATAAPGGKPTPTVVPTLTPAHTPVPSPTAAASRWRQLAGPDALGADAWVADAIWWEGAWVAVGAIGDQYAGEARAWRSTDGISWEPAVVEQAAGSWTTAVVPAPAGGLVAVGVTNDR